MWRVDPNYNETLPRCAKFVPGQGHKDPAAYREHLDNMQMSDFMFTPYESHRHVKPLIDVCWFSGWLRCGDKKGMHLPERVLRQYGYVQTIPRDPAASAPSNMTLEQIDQVYSEEMESRLIEGDMRGAAVQNPWDHQPGYMAWYHRVSHPKMLRLEAHEHPPEPPHLEVLIEQQTRGEVRDLFQICNDVRLELERSIRDGEALQGTPIYDTVHRVLAMVSPATVYSSRRRRPGAPMYPYHSRPRATQ